MPILFFQSLIVSLCLLGLTTHGLAQQDDLPPNSITTINDAMNTLTKGVFSEKKLAEALRQLKNENVKGSLLMNIDRKVPHGRVVRLMSVVRELGFQHIVFGTQSAQPE